jgi:hypothetical protein
MEALVIMQSPESGWRNISPTAHHSIANAIMHFLIQAMEEKLLGDVMAIASLGALPYRESIQKITSLAPTFMRQIMRRKLPRLFFFTRSCRHMIWAIAALPVTSINVAGMASFLICPTTTAVVPRDMLMAHLASLQILFAMQRV